jgi:hypothetical protein
MRRTGLLLGALVVLLVVLAGAAAVQAQNIEPQPVVPPSCGDMTKYDVNKDGRVNWADLQLWVETVDQSGLCQMGGPLGSCPAWTDVNGDGLVNIEDLHAIDMFMRWCVNPPRNTFVRH